MFLIMKYAPIHRSILFPVLAVIVLCLTTPALIGEAAIRSEIIGRSVEGRPISVERLGSGPIDLLIVGGIHGGYEANSVLLARRVAEHFRTNPDELNSRFTIHVIDLMNPDGLFLITGGGSLKISTSAGPTGFPGASTPTELT
jgi:murein tripeptide amidase MpaA